VTEQQLRKALPVWTTMATAEEPSA